ncbi:hypothetical protein [Serratia sp. G204Y]|uniref:hypothetical protein n=1 Tax=Serratia TaxID=613 RepID=UPI003EB6DDF5
MTLTTTEELKHLASSDNANELTRRLARECLANREAQPVALVDLRPAASGSICWQNGGKDLPHGTELFTAQPASAVPGEAKLGEMPFLGKSERGYVRGWNACRAAMLAQHVSGGYKLPDSVLVLLNHIEDVLDDENWNRNSVKKWNAVTMLSASPEGGNG